MGTYFLNKLLTLDNPIIKEVRGRGLFIGLELTTKARPYCEKLMVRGLLCKETHENTIRLAPPLIITVQELDWAFEQIQAAFQQASATKRTRLVQAVPASAPRSSDSDTRCKI